MIQTYVHVRDLIQTEHSDHYEGYDQEIINERAHEYTKHGMRSKMNIKPSGYILKGNTRLAAIVKSGLEYVPISLPAFLGLYINSDASSIRIRQSIIDELMNTDENSVNTYQWSFPVQKPRDQAKADIKDKIHTGDTYAYYNLGCVNSLEVAQMLPFPQKFYQNIEKEKIAQKEGSRSS